MRKQGIAAMEFNLSIFTQILVCIFNILVYIIVVLYQDDKLFLE